MDVLFVAFASCFVPLQISQRGLACADPQMGSRCRTEGFLESFPAVHTMTSVHGKAATGHLSPHTCCYGDAAAAALPPPNIPHTYASLRVEVELHCSPGAEAGPSPGRVGCRSSCGREMGWD
uniref:Secreted protein n=1 Tax=Knipowitschia caucasica TaxID=637954 RepID=A0AAV2KEC1_KNICA